MAQAVIVLGRSGSGKSTSIKTLDPKSTFVISCLGKILPFKNSNAIYNTANKNYIKVHSDPEHRKYTWQSVRDLLININNTKHINTVVIDDATFIMRDEYFDRTNERGYDKYTELANHFRTILQTCSNMRDDIIVYLMLHDDNIESDGTIVGRKVATVGKLLDKMYDPLMTVNITLYCAPQYNTEGKIQQYGFYTKECKVDGIPTPCKTPDGMFESGYIPNDLQLVNNAIFEYYGINSVNNKQ